MSDKSNTVAGSGISLGAAMAVAISWSLYGSVHWAFIHGVFGWAYVIYYCFQSGRL